MENAPRSEQPVKAPFDFSEYTQPEAPQEVEVAAETPFDFSKYQGGQKTFEEISDDISKENQLTKVYDFSDDNIASGGPILRDATPAEIYDKGRRDQQAEQSAQRGSKLGGNTIQKLIRRG